MLLACGSSKLFDLALDLGSGLWAMGSQIGRSIRVDLRGVRECRTHACMVLIIFFKDVYSITLEIVVGTYYVGMRRGTYSRRARGVSAHGFFDT